MVGLAALGAVLFELMVHQFLPIEFRRRHNDVAAAIFSVVGVTFALLLAFVAMLAGTASTRRRLLLMQRPQPSLASAMLQSDWPVPRRP